MATSKEFCEYVLEQLDLLDDARVRPMMGEYLLYYREVLVGGIYDERLLLKETPSLAEYHLPQVVPYDSAKRTMFYVEDLEDKARLKELIQLTYTEFSSKK